MISGNDNPEKIRLCIDEGASGFLPKSESQETLLPALRLVLAGGIYLPLRAIQTITPAQLPSTASSQQSLLSTRQQEILNLAIKGTPNKVISRTLDIAEGTVKAHLSRIYQLLGVRNRTEAVYITASRQIDAGIKK